MARSRYIYVVAGGDFPSISFFTVKKEALAYLRSLDDRFATVVRAKHVDGKGANWRDAETIASKEKETSDEQ